MSARRIVATKMYGYGWWPGPGGPPREGAASTVRGKTHNEMPYEATADALAAAGTNLVLAQNQLDPLPASDVGQTPPGREYSDLRLRNVLRARGMRVFESTAMFFHPAHYRERPELRPVAPDGTVMVPADWYVGLCPSSEEYVEERVQLLRRVVTELEADGVFISFIRFPGFWETWVPGTKRVTIPEYCFCTRCRGRFARETGNALPNELSAAAALLQGELRRPWTEWKCKLITDVVRQAREAVREVAPEAELMINKIPFVGDDLCNVSEEVLGQQVESLAEFAEYIEVMVYHQILKRSPAEWIPAVAAALRARTERAVIPCLQVRPTYLDGIYAAARRNPEIGPAEFRACVEAVASSAADGIMTYHWQDVLLQDARSNGAYTAALREFAPRGLKIAEN